MLLVRFNMAAHCSHFYSLIFNNAICLLWQEECFHRFTACSLVSCHPILVSSLLSTVASEAGLTDRGRLYMQVDLSKAGPTL